VANETNRETLSHVRNKKKNAADNLSAASGHPVAQTGKKESLFKDG